ncbi:MAG: hypothetical protein V8Q95_06375 [Collinsella sp.]
MGYSLVNILGGLLIVTSTMVVVSKTIPSAIKWYAIQSVVLVGVLAHPRCLTTGASELLMWAGSAFVTKVDPRSVHSQPCLQKDGFACR